MPGSATPAAHNVMVPSVTDASLDVSAAPPATGVLYIAGHGRSGSTLLGVLLGGHPAIVGMGEAHRLTLDVDERRCADGRLPEDHDFWRPVIAAVCARAGVPVGEWKERLPTSAPRASGPTRRLLDAELVAAAGPLAEWVRAVPPLSRYRAAIDHSLAFMDEAARQAGASWVVDASKNPARMKALWLERPQAVRVVHLVRDGRAVASSNRRREGTPVEASLRRWVAENAKVRVALATVPATQRRVLHYEDLCADPGAVLADLAAWLGLDDDPGMLDPPPERHVQVSANEWLYRAPDEPVRIALDDGWRATWRAADEATALAVAGRALRREGYPPR